MRSRGVKSSLWQALPPPTEATIRSTCVIRGGHLVPHVLLWRAPRVPLQGCLLVDSNIVGTLVWVFFRLDVFIVEYLLHCRLLAFRSSLPVSSDEPEAPSMVRTNL